ncbi:MAG TPA: NADH-quinone oxidoreductase subunit L [Sphingobacteriaceae bacterium]|nr:NADH-quinone oxidoreductase subunit L [Sphingobacteriaceae bacterium]
MEAVEPQKYVLLALVAVLLPFCAFIRLLLAKNTSGSAFYAITGISLSFIISIFIFSNTWNEQFIHQQVDWFTIGGTTFRVGILINNLSVLMMVLVTGISLLVHVYSIAYMKKDPLIHRYWGYLGLFCAAMLLLVMADNLLVLYMAWELVGFSSYLLIGFWFTKDAASQAARKAFIMNRIGDIGFLIGLFILYTQFGTLDIQKLFGQDGLVLSATVHSDLWISSINQMPATWLTIAGIAFFMGAVAKSAQFPLHTWLPDAMEGPTSVSSLIHAATMVAAGVFLVARIFPLFNDTVLLVITITGLFTALMAATIALTQNDIKRILAFSTISQLGFMMLAMGIGAVDGGIFHLATHAFFKCLLFLAAGALIHALAHLKEKDDLDFDIQDIRNMGGLRTLMPVTFYTMLVASIALIGLPLTSGYLSKDAILIRAFEWAESKALIFTIVPYTALLVSWLTAFYISRLIFKVFFGKWRLQKGFKNIFTLHDSPAEMKYPMIILAVCCLFPLFSSNPLLFETSWILNGFHGTNSLQRVNAYHTIIPAAVNTISIMVMYICYRWYVKPGYSIANNNLLYRFSENQWYFNCIYDVLVVKPVNTFAKAIFWFERKVVDGLVNLTGRAGLLFSAISAWVDEYIIDAAVNNLALLAKKIGDFTRHFQTGRVQHYLVTMLLFVLTVFVLKYFSQLL